MKNKEDLRVTKTKLAIKNAFYELINEKDFDKISVSDIASRALINRATFYLHYEDKYQLLNCLEEEIFNEIEHYSNMITRENLKDCFEQKQPFPHIINLLSHVQNNPELFKLIAHSNLGMPFYNKIGEKLNQKMFELLPNLKSNEITSQYSIGISTAIFSSILNQWITNELNESKEEIAALITQMILIVINLNASPVSSL